MAFLDLASVDLIVISGFHQDKMAEGTRPNLLQTFILVLNLILNRTNHLPPDFKSKNQNK